jgi:hypothetical protein
MARQIDPDLQQQRRRTRRERVDQLVEKVRAGMTQRKPYDEGSLWSHDIRDLKHEVWGRNGIRDHLRTKLVAALGDAEGNSVLDSLFEPGGLETNRRTLRRLKIDLLADRAVMIDELVEEARGVLPEAEKARHEYDAARKASEDAEIAAAEAELEARAKRENARRLSHDDVLALLKGTGYTESLLGPIGVAFDIALERGVITDTEFRLGARRYGDMFRSFD